MEATKTSVQITQELLAIVSHHKETSGQRQNGDNYGQNNMDDMIRALQEELSLYGDNIGSTVERSNPYFTADKPDERLFREAIMQLREQAGEIPESLQRIFDKLLVTS
jgi:hypothetical protein